MQGLLELIPDIKCALIILKMQISKEMEQMNKIIHTKVQIADILDPLFSSREEIISLKEDLGR